MTSIVALIPARGGSRRIPGKNLKALGGHQLIAYTIAAARQSGIFGADIYVSTEDEATAEVARDYGADIITRPLAFAFDSSPDIEWVKQALDWLDADPGEFAILRPSSPFRTAKTIQRAWKLWQSAEAECVDWDSLRAVEPARQHPAKMWRRSGNLLWPLLLQADAAPWHSSPTQSLPEVYVQNASLEIAWTATVHDTGTIAGHRIAPFVTEGYEGFDLNTPEDWLLAEALIERGLAVLPEIT